MLQTTPPSNKKPHPLSSRARVCSPLSLGLTKRLPHVTALSWHLSPGGADFLGIPSRGGWGMRERPRPGLPRESFTVACALQPQGVAWGLEWEGVGAPSRMSCQPPGPWPQATV